MQRSFRKPVEYPAGEQRPLPRILSDGDADRVDRSQRVAAPDPGRGSVTLVGAGPGDPELLTLKAVRALQAADVILFDDLVSDKILELARREAKRMLVGKRGGRKSCRQTDINELMIKLAKQVVRLKSGDPMIFGRAGEEIEQLAKEGISVTVVPGISAGIAMASELGISLTHRDSAHSVRFITGHSRKGELPADLDWQGIADPETTLIFYMGGRTSTEIANRLIAHGLSPQTHVLIAICVSRANSRHHFTTLGGLCSSGLPVETSQPVLIGIGNVFKDRPHLSQGCAPSSHQGGSLGEERPERRVGSFV